VSALPRLVLAELGRLRSRRVALVTALVLVGVIGLFQIVVNDLASPPGAEERAAGQAAYEESLRSWQDERDTYLEQCTAGGQTREQCDADYPPPSPGDFISDATPFAEIGSTVTSLAAYLSMLGAFLVGASFIGAEYSSGSLANWLTFVPRRLLVHASKAVAVAVGSALAGAAVAFSLAGLAAAQVALYDQPLTGGGHVAAESGRVVVLAVVAGVVGFALALLTRHTVAALGFPLAYVIVGTVLGGLTYDGDGALAWLPPYLPERNLTAFLQHGTTYTQYVERITPQGVSYEELTRHISFGHSAVYWLVLLVVAVVASALVFRRRDVT
jgi:ABC-2 type transport system permease protein